ncbi:hypothetical protein RvY_12507 [Ramazzottius varieornatus]|uniref:Gamma-glutamyltransferase n=1 Tax=Ramazzottius varieornatus TaxID=947166 RepID=A0A1D1VM15_RAMVA|nr:hypothetical protein RvY_12507 [Ramazzottius varieornatus]
MSRPDGTTPTNNRHGTSALVTSGAGYSTTDGSVVDGVRPSQHTTSIAIDVIPLKKVPPSVTNGRHIGVSNGHYPAPTKKHSDKSRRRHLVKMVAAASLVICVLTAAVVCGVYFGVAKAAPLPGKAPLPNTAEMQGNASASILGSYSRQSVASDAANCSIVGNDILNKGGSAAEAAIAAALCAGLYHPHSCGIGGGFFMVVYDRKRGNATAIDAREMAPGASTELMYVQNKNYSSTKGWQAMGVPGEIAGYRQAYDLFGAGKLSWRDIFEHSINLARNGLVVNEVLAGALRGAEEDIKNYDAGLTDTFINKATGQIYKEGEIIRYPELANTLETIATEEGVDSFYRGDLARKMVKDIQDGGGIITLDDMANYRVTVSNATQLPLPGTNGQSRGKVFGVPPPAGSLVLQYIVNIMDGYGYGNNTIWDTMTDEQKIQFYQRFAEAMKYAYARRTELGDLKFEPEVADIKETLLSPWFGHLTRMLINENQTSNNTKAYGVEVVANLQKTGTSHISVIDKDGNAASITTTINTHFGSRRVSQSTGIILNNEMDDFTTNPNQPNYYGLPPSYANRIEPGKRPQSSCAPVIVTDGNGEARIVMGASGGSRIISATANALLRVMYLGQDVKEAIDAPRLHHQLLPIQLEYEYGFVRKHLEGLQQKGHNVQFSSTFAVVQGLVRTDDGMIEANCDYRKKGAPAGN